MSRRVIMPSLLHPRETARAARARDPEAAAALLMRAEDILSGRFEILGFGLLSFGVPVDWHWEPTCDRRSPRVHFSRVDPLDVERVGDHKVVWELNRHGWMVTLAQAYALTGDPRFGASAARLLVEWLDANPPATGVNWASSLEVGLRLVSWLYAWPIFRSAEAFAHATRRRWVQSMDAHARHVRSYPSVYFSPNTHLTGEALALRLCGLALPELSAAASYRRTGERILEQEMERQLLGDGFHFEQSACYHRYTTEILLADYLAGSLNGWHEQGGRARLSRAIDAMLPLVRPNGCLVNVGDEDGGQLLRLSGRDPLDIRPLLAAAAALLDRSDLKAIVGALPAEVIWLLGVEGAERYDRLASGGVPPLVQRLPSAGYVSVRNAWTATADHLLIDAGPHGAARCGFGHAHDDALSVSIDAGGRALVLDAGCGSYSNPSVRDGLRGTFAHSSVWIDGRPRNRPGRAFEWLTSSHGRLDHVIAGAGVTLIEASQWIGPVREHRVRHTRAIVYRSGHGWFIRDRVEGTGAHEVTLQWVLAGPRVLWEASGGTVQGDNGALAVLMTRGAAEVSRDLVDVAVSTRYGFVESATAYRVTVTTRLPVEFVTLIRGAGSVPPRLEEQPSDSLPKGAGAYRCIRDLATGDILTLFEDERRAAAPAGPTIVWTSQPVDESPIRDAAEGRPAPVHGVEWTKDSCSFTSFRRGNASPISAEEPST